MHLPQEGTEAAKTSFLSSSTEEEREENIAPPSTRYFSSFFAAPPRVTSTPEVRVRSWCARPAHEVLR